MSRSKAAGKIGFTSVRRTPTSTTPKATAKIKNPKRDLIKKYNLPEEYEKLDNFQLLDIIYELQDGVKTIKTEEGETEEPKTVDDVLQEIKKNNKIFPTAQENQKLDYYRGLQARKEFEDFYLQYTPKADVKLDFKCRFCGNLGASLLPPRFFSSDEAPRIYVQCLGCQKIQAP
jgi:hypothetical protein